MKKKAWRILLAAGLLLAILVVPIPKSPYKDGGTREYAALTYKIVDWNRMTGDTIYDKTSIYFFPNNFKSIDSLWYSEKDKVEASFVATVLEINDSSVVVQPEQDSAILTSGDKVTFGISKLNNIAAEVGSTVQVIYTGEVMESYPVQIHAVKWDLVHDHREKAYAGEWLNKETAEKYDHPIFEDIIITEIYADCFFATPVIPMPYEIKLNGQLSEDWCVGDQVICTYENTYYDDQNHKVEADFLTVKPSDFELDPNACYKPVIYLYPETETDVSVELLLDGKLTCTYPAYTGGWRVTAAPDGTLTDGNGQTYNYLYWEGETHAQWDMREGFCVKGEDTAAFLEDALEKLGLNRREANEFIVYWLPLMEQNPYNIIAFQTDAYTDAAQLQVAPTPDTVIRVFMTWQAADAYVQLLPQKLSAPERIGFTVVEWGGTEKK